MQPITSQARKLVQEKMPHFLDEVRSVQASVRGTRKRARLTLRLDQFQDDPFQLYACLWYARSEGIDVLLSARLMQD